MAFGNISTLYTDVTATAQSVSWGTLVRKLRSSSNATDDTTTTTDHGTGGNVTRTEKFYNNNAVDDTEANFGVAVDATDMGSTSSARRYYPSGNHVLTTRIHNSGAVAKSGCVLTMYVYRVASAAAGRGRTLLGSASSSSFSTGSLSAPVTVTVTAALGEIIFEADETIQYSMELNAPGTAVTGETYTFHCGTNSGVVIEIDTPTLGYYYTQSHSVTGIGTVAGATDTGILVKEPLAVIGVGTIAQAELVNALVTVGVTGVGTVAETLLVSESLAVIGVGTVVGRAQIAFGDIPTGSGGNTYSRARVVNA